jgi:hypothetical protein
MYHYPLGKLAAIIKAILGRNLPAAGMVWLDNEARAVAETRDMGRLGVAFVMVPRKTGKALINVSGADNAEIQSILPGLRVNDWSADRLARVYLLMHADTSDETRYMRTIENLFVTGEMNEQVALYSALPLLAYASRWTKRCAEGIRSNIGMVLEAVMCDNPFPAEHLDEAAWNQMVLKAIFTEKPLLRIFRLRDRANERLAMSLSDFAHERWAAQRSVNPVVWICISDFVNDTLYADVKRLAFSTETFERQAAALVCAESKDLRTKKLLDDHPELNAMIKEGLSWASLDAAVREAQVR